MDFVHNGDVNLQPFSIGKVYIFPVDRSDWEVAVIYVFEPLESKPTI